MKTGLSRWGLVVLWMIAIFIGSSIGNLPTFDNGLTDLLVHWTAHLFEYAVLSILLQRALSADRQIGWREIAIALIVIAVYGLSDEFHQRFVTGRRSDAATVLLDMAGGLIGAAIWQWRRRMKSESANQRLSD